jgi:prepilin-type N-terminal cleavage/methylation domain-containing protein
MKRAVKGFTIIELVVVMAIIGILMAILIPNLISYVNDARQVTANSAARLVYTSATNLITKVKIAGAPTPKDVTSTYAIKQDVTINDNFKGDTEFDDGKFSNNMSVYAGELPKGSYYKIYFTENGEIGATLWAESEYSKVVGSFPVQRDSSDIGNGAIRSLNAKDYIA